MTSSEILTGARTMWELVDRRAAASPGHPMLIAPSGETVTFGGAMATNVTFVDSATLTATTPAHTTGTVDVVVTNPDTGTGTGTGLFTYAVVNSMPGAKPQGVPAGRHPDLAPASVAAFGRRRDPATVWARGMPSRAGALGTGHHADLCRGRPSDGPAGHARDRMMLAAHHPQTDRDSLEWEPHGPMRPPPAARRTLRASGAGMMSASKR